MTPVDSIKDVVRSSVEVPEFDKHLKKAGGHIGRNVVEITIKMKTIVQKSLKKQLHLNKHILTSWHKKISRWVDMLLKSNNERSIKSNERNVF